MGCLSPVGYSTIWNSDKEKLRLRVGGPSLKSQHTGSRAGLHASPAAPHPSPQAVPWSWSASRGLLSGCNSPSSSEDQALSVASVMANCSATPVGMDPAQRGQEGTGGQAPHAGSWGCPSVVRGIRVPINARNTQHCISLPRPVVKNPPANAGDVRDTGWNPGSERSPGVGNGNPLSILCLENPMDRGAWWATVHKSWTRLKWLSTPRQCTGGTLGPLRTRPGQSVPHPRPRWPAAKRGSHSSSGRWQ